MLTDRTIWRAIGLALLLMGPACAEPAADSLAAICRGLVIKPNDRSLQSQLLHEYESAEGLELKGRLGVIECLSARLRNDRAAATRLKDYLSKHHPFHADLKYLSDQYTGALCHDCQGRGDTPSGDGIRHRCIPCRGLGWIVSMEQTAQIRKALLRRIAYDRPQLEPRRQLSIVDPLNKVDGLVAEYLDSEGDKDKQDEIRRQAIGILADYARKARVPLRAEILEKGIDGEGMGRIRIGSFSFLEDPALHVESLGLMMPRWLRVRMTVAELRAIDDEKTVTLLATPRYFSDRIAGDDLHADEQLLMAIRPRNSVRLFGSLTATHYRCQIGAHWFDDPFQAPLRSVAP